MRTYFYHAFAFFAVVLLCTGCDALKRDIEITITAVDANTNLRLKHFYYAVDYSSSFDDGEIFELPKSELKALKAAGFRVKGKEDLSRISVAMNNCSPYEQRFDSNEPPRTTRIPSDSTSVMVYVYKEGYSMECIEVSSGGKRVTVTAKLCPNKGVQGTVLDNSGKPVQGMSIFVGRDRPLIAELSTKYAPSSFTTSWLEGAFWIPASCREIDGVVAWRPSQPPIWTPVAPEDKTVSVTLPPKRELPITVVTDGEPLPKASILIEYLAEDDRAYWHAEAHCDTQGKTSALAFPDARLNLELSLLTKKGKWTIRKSSDFSSPYVLDKNESSRTGAVAEMRLFREKGMPVTVPKNTVEPVVVNLAKATSEVTVSIPNAEKFKPCFLFMNMVLLTDDGEIIYGGTRSPWSESFHFAPLPAGRLFLAASTLGQKGQGCAGLMRRIEDGESLSIPLPLTSGTAHISGKVTGKDSGLHYNYALCPAGLTLEDVKTIAQWRSGSCIPAICYADRKTAKTDDFTFSAVPKGEYSFFVESLSPQGESEIVAFQPVSVGENAQMEIKIDLAVL